MNDKEERTRLPDLRIKSCMVIVGGMIIGLFALSSMTSPHKTTLEASIKSNIHIQKEHKNIKNRIEKLELKIDQLEKRI